MSQAVHDKVGSEKVIWMVATDQKAAESGVKTVKLVKVDAGKLFDSLLRYLLGEQPNLHLDNHFTWSDLLKFFMRKIGAYLFGIKANISIYFKF